MRRRVMILIVFTAVCAPLNAQPPAGKAIIDGTVSITIYSDFRNPDKFKFRDVTVDGKVLYLPSSDTSSDAQVLRAAFGDAVLLCKAMSGDHKFESSNIDEVSLANDENGTPTGDARFTNFTVSVTPKQGGLVLICLNIDAYVNDEHVSQKLTFRPALTLSPGDGKHLDLNKLFEVIGVREWN
jgi:hypothetical protein